MANQSHWERFVQERAAWRVHRPLRLRLKYIWQRLTRGFSDDQIWDLNITIADFIYPRLEYYVRYQSEYGKHLPDDLRQDPAAWLEVLNKMVYAFRLTYEADPYEWVEHNDAIQEGMTLFAKYYSELYE